MRLRLLVLAVALGACPRFAQPSPERKLSFPRDHADHPEFKTEWWYWNGHLKSRSGKRYDFFLSFTRHNPRGDRMLGMPVLWPWQSWLGLFAVTDRERGVYRARAKMNYPDWLAAGADSEVPFVWHDSWGAQWADGAFYVVTHLDGAVYHLTFKALTAPVLYGHQGYVDLANAPHHLYSFTNMAVSGTRVEGGLSDPVEGVGWFDHFIGHVRSASVREWDWMSLQLDDGYQYMLGQVRPDDGSPPRPYVNFEVDPTGRPTTLPADQPRWTLRRTWSSPANETYRLYWTLQAPELSLEVEPVIEAQEFRAPPVRKFWEGAVRVRGQHRGRQVSGEGFLETVAQGGMPVDLIRFSQ